MDRRGIVGKLKPKAGGAFGTEMRRRISNETFGGALLRALCKFGKRSWHLAFGHDHALPLAAVSRAP
jgi:hypothetical protein